MLPNNLIKKVTFLLTKSIFSSRSKIEVMLRNNILKDFSFSFRYVFPPISEGIFKLFFTG